MFIGLSVIWNPTDITDELLMARLSKELEHLESFRAADVIRSGITQIGLQCLDACHSDIQ